MIDHALDMILTIGVLSFWFLFPLGMFFAVSQLDKNSEQILRMPDHDEETFPERNVAESKPVPTGRPRLLPH